MMGKKASKSADAALERARIRKAQSGCRSARDALMLASWPAIRAFVSRKYPVCRHYHEDLVQECLLALPGIVQRYDLAHPARVRLMTFARQHLVGVTAQTLRQLSPESERVGTEDIAEVGTEAPGDLPECCAQVESSAQVVRAALKGLDPRSQAIVSLRQREDPVPLRVLAASYAISSTGVLKIQRAAMAKLSQAIPRDRVLI